MAARPRRGKKPVVLHSLRVGIALMTAGYNTNVVIAGLLHDIIEKTGISPGQIARRFGAEVALMVAANTNNGRIHDPLERYEDSVERCAATGDGALLVRAADLIDNCDRLTTTQASPARLEKIAEKLRLLVRVGRDHIGAEPIYEELVRRQRRLSRKVGPVAVLKMAKKHHLAAKAARVASGHRRHR